MEQRMFNRRYTGSPDKWRTNFIFWAVVGLLAGLWISLFPQQLAAQCPAGSFVPPNDIMDPSFHDVLVFTQDPDGKFLIGGTFAPGGLARLNSDGSLDETFNPPNFVFPGSVAILEVVRLADGDYMVGGFFTAPVRHIVRLNSDGSIDDSFVPPTFTAPSGLNVFVTSILPTADGKFLVGGTFWQPKNGVVKLNSDGSLGAQTRLSHKIVDTAIIR